MTPRTSAFQLRRRPSITLVLWFVFLLLLVVLLPLFHVIFGDRSKIFFLKNPTELDGARRAWAAMWKRSLAKNPTELGGPRRVRAVTLTSLGERQDLPIPGNHRG